MSKISRRTFVEGAGVGIVATTIPLSAAQAAETALEGAQPLAKNKYKAR
jgi:hypothetical protein